MTDHMLDSILVAQKDALLADINATYEQPADEALTALVGVTARLVFVHRLWSAAGYRYKAIEITRRLRERLAEIADKNPRRPTIQERVRVLAEDIRRTF